MLLFISYTVLFSVNTLKFSPDFLHAKMNAVFWEEYALKPYINLLFESKVEEPILMTNLEFLINVLI